MNVLGVKFTSLLSTHPYDININYFQMQKYDTNQPVKVENLQLTAANKMKCESGV